MKNTFYNSLPYLIATLLILFGISHFTFGNFLIDFFPSFIPKTLQLFLIYFTGVLEIILGIGLLLPKYRKISAMLTIGMLIAYFPVHIRDLFVDHPVAGSPTAAIARIFIQFLFIYIAWIIYKESLDQDLQD